LRCFPRDLAPIGRLAAELPNHFRVDVHTTAGRAVVITVSGELDLASCPMLEQELDRALMADVALVVVDLSGLDFIDSTGIGLLVRAHKQAQDSGHELGLVQGGGQVQRLLSLTGLSDRLAVADSLDELLG
jgi:anti-sigma B factor antagonist